MAVINSLKKVIDDAYTNGKYDYHTFRKVSSQASTSGYWVDLSMAPGNPTTNFYIGGERSATVPVNWYKKGIWHGGNVAPDRKYLHKICMLSTSANVAPAPFLLCDYLMYYPLIDMDNTDPQDLYNTDDGFVGDPVTLPRYITGTGVQAFLVATNPYVGGSQFQITYTNSLGVSGQTSKICTTNTATYIGTIVSSNTAGLRQYGCFVEMDANDIGIRSVQNIQFTIPNGGLAALVLVKPIATVMTREVTAWAEFDFIKDKPSFPRIYDGAYLNFLTMPSGSIAAVPIVGETTFIWGS